MGWLAAPINPPCRFKADLSSNVAVFNGKVLEDLHVSGTKSIVIIVFVKGGWAKKVSVFHFDATFHFQIIAGRASPV